MHGFRPDVKKDVMIMQPTIIEELIDAAEISEASNHATATLTRTSDTAMATELADLRTAVAVLNSIFNQEQTFPVHPAERGIRKFQFILYTIIVQNFCGQGKTQYDHLGLRGWRVHYAPDVDEHMDFPEKRFANSANSTSGCTPKNDDRHQIGKFSGIHTAIGGRGYTVDNSRCKIVKEYWRVATRQYCLTILHVTPLASVSVSGIDILLPVQTCLLQRLFPSPPALPRNPKYFTSILDTL